MLSKGLLFIVSAPAGAGKTTLVARLAEEFDRVVTSVSFTTRTPRPGEVNGVHYNFVNAEQFKQKVAAGDFLEHVSLYEKEYGTSKEWVEEQLKKGRHVILTIDMQGALLLKAKKNIHAIYIFVLPPSLEVLQERLHKRKTDSAASIKARLDWAKKEIDYAGSYDYNIVNDDLNTAYDALRSILIAEEHRVKNF